MLLRASASHIIHADKVRTLHLELCHNNVFIFNYSISFGILLILQVDFS